MYIDKIISWKSEKEFVANYKCEFCGNSLDNEYGLNDKEFYEEIIPRLHCKECDMSIK